MRGDSRRQRRRVEPTLDAIRALKPEVTLVEYSVTGPKSQGLRVRVYPDRRKTWLFAFRRPVPLAEDDIKDVRGGKKFAKGAPTKMGLGSVKLEEDDKGLTIKEAQAKAKHHHSNLEDGTNPVEEERAASKRVTEGSVEALVKDFLASREVAKWRPSSRKEFGRLLRVEVVPVLGKRPPATITRSDVRDLVEKIADGRDGTKPAPVVANRTLRAIKMLWSWALDREKVDSSPAAGLKPPSEERPRDISYTDDELRRIMTAAQGDTDVHDLLSLLLLTGGRLREVMDATWPEIVWDHKERDGGKLVVLPAWRLPPERSKIGRKKPRARIVPLVESAASILKTRSKVRRIGTDRVFPKMTSRPTKKLTAMKGDSGVEFMPHGFRHTIRTRLLKLGVAPHLIEEVLGHTVGGMAGVYTASSSSEDMVPQVRRALEAWEAEVLAAMSEKKAEEAGA